MTIPEPFHPPTPPTPASNTEIDLLRDLVEIGRTQIQLLEGISNQLAPLVELSLIESTLETVSSTVSTFLADWLAAQEQPPPPNQATTGTVFVQGPQGEKNMAITVDSTGQQLLFQFDDDHGDIAAPPAGDGSGLVVTLTSDNPAVATVGVTSSGTDANGNAQYGAPLTFGVDGTFNGGATVANTSGADLLDDDGVTAFVQPATTPVTVAAGQATTGSVTEEPGA